MTISDEGAGNVVAPHDGLVLIMRLRFLLAMAVSATIFWYVGWWVTVPVDPQGPVSLLLVDQGVVAMAELLGLAVVASGLAVAICGPGAIATPSGSAHRGPLAIAVGLASLGLHGAQLDALVLYRLNPPGAGAIGLDPFPVWALIAECWLWLALISVGFVVGRWVEGWFSPGQTAPPASLPTADHSSDVRQGLGTIAITALVAWTVLSFSIGTDANPILKGQIYFSLGLSFLLGALAAHWFLRTDSRPWALVAVAVVATVAYVFGEPDQETITAARELGTHVNIRPFARPLPIEFASMGAAGVLLEGEAMRFFLAMFGIRSEEGRKPKADA
jgi:hypothetical protein